MGSPKATTNMNLSTIASLVLLAAVGTVAYDSGADDSEDSVVPYEDQAPELVQYAPQQNQDLESRIEAKAEVPVTQLAEEESLPGQQSGQQIGPTNGAQRGGSSADRHQHTFFFRRRRL